MGNQKKQPPSTFERRDFLKVGTAATVGFLARGVVPQAAHALPPLPSNAATPEAMPTRNLGRTGYRVGAFSLGGQAAIEKSINEDVAVPLVERALDLGINYIDTAAMYGRGRSQRYIGQVMKRRRSETFLATKTHNRTRDGSLRLLEESLRLLQTDHLDLWQIHNLSRMEQVEQIFAPDGAVQALLEAREQGIVRYLGVTGHADPHVLAEAIRRFPFDTILMAINAADMREAVFYVLSQPVSTIIIGCDSIAQLEQNVQLAREFTPLNEQQLASLVDRTQPIHRQALFFRRWG